MLVPIVMAYGSLARMLEPLCVINRLVSGVLVHRLLVVVVILAYGSLARMLEPLCVIIRLVSRVLVHGLLVVMTILTVWWLLLVLTHWWLWVLGIGLWVEWSRELRLWVLVWGLLIVLVIWVLVVSLNAIFGLVSGIFVLFIFLVWFPIFRCPMGGVCFPDFPIVEGGGVGYLPIWV